VIDARVPRIRELLGDDATFVRAPGRVNLIGGQVDYHEGLVVSAALDRDVLVGFVPSDTGRVVVRSLDLDGAVAVAADGSDDATHVEPAWGRLVAGVVSSLARRARPPVGIDAVVASNVSIGAGLSSSAAFEVSVALALAAAADAEIELRELALACQEAEHESTGVLCGLQDQLTSLFGVAGSALVLDCRSLEMRALPLPDDVAIVIVHSGVERTLERSEWVQRREESFAIARSLGLDVLRDATAEQVATSPRGRHVVSEIARVQRFAAALERGDVDALGPLLLASHASSRDDMQVSIPELDALVESLVEAGALGARLTGGGFGGCVVALVPADGAIAVSEQACDAYRAATGRDPTAWITRPASGAGEVRP
jgi:galactokinase